MGDKVTMKSEDDADTVSFVFENMKEFGDSISLHCTKDGLKFTVDGDIGVCNVNVKPRMSSGEKKKTGEEGEEMKEEPEEEEEEDKAKEDDSVAINCEEPVTAAFALRYLNFFTKATPLASACTIQLDDDKPLIIEYELNAGDADEASANNGSCGFLRFFLAPKIDE